MTAISVVMSVYEENELGIKRSVDSILNQTFKDFELIIIIDNPNNTEAIELIKKYASADSRIKYEVHKKNIKQSASLNEGIKMAAGKYIARQDTEDVSTPERLQKQYDYMQEHADVDVLGTAQRYVDVENNLSFLIQYKPVVGDEIKRHNPIGHPSVLIRKETFYKYGFYIENIWEYELWVIWYLKGVIFHNLQEPYYDYYQTKAEKISKVKIYLINDTNCKMKYAKALKFNLGDYIYLFAERICLLLPSTLIIKLLYYVYRNSHAKKGRVIK